MTVGRPDRDDFVDIIGSLTNFVQNERVKAYNEGVDMMLNSARDWMSLKNYSTSATNLPDLLDDLMSQVDDAVGETSPTKEG